MNFFRYLKTKTQKFLFWFTFVAFSLFLPFKTAKAIPGLDILTAPFVFLAKFATAFVIAVPVSWGILALSQVFLNWASNPALVGGITTNPFVMEGWGMVRDFSNLFFILIVVAIGIATALRIKQYEVKKTLPRLIVVAILINFSPVICGVVIDVSNILMGYFMTAGAAGFGDALNLAGSAGAFLMDSMRSALGNWSEVWRGVLFVKLIFAIGFNFFAAFVLALLGVLFMVRNLYLWVLVIFSPFAFVSAVLPGTKKTVFNWWSKNFLQWTFIGVAASFFIYLSQLMLHLGTKSLMATPATGVTDFGGRTITNIMVLAVPFIFLVIGYSVTLAMAPMGANAVMGAVRKGGKKLYGKTGGRVVQNLRQEARKTGEKLYHRTVGRATGAAKKITGKIIAKRPDAEGHRNRYAQARGVKKIGKAISRTVLPYRIRERLTTSADAKTQEAALTTIAKHKETADKLKTKAGRRDGYNKAKSKGERLAYIQSALENKEIDGYSEPEIQKAIEEAGTINKKLAEDIMQAGPDLAQKLYEGYAEKYKDTEKAYIAATMSGDRPESNKLNNQMKSQEEIMKSKGLWMNAEDRNRYGTLETKIVQTTKTKDVDKFRKEYVTGANADHFMKLIQDAKNGGRSAWGGNALGKLSEEYGLKAVDQYNETSEKLLETMGKWFNAKDPKKAKHPTARWIRNSPGAAAAGYRTPTGKPIPGGGGGGPVPGGGGGKRSGVNMVLTGRRGRREPSAEERGGIDSRKNPVHTQEDINMQQSKDGSWKPKKTRSAREPGPEER